MNYLCSSFFPFAGKDDDVINYLCSEEEHAANLQLLLDSDNPDIEEGAYEDDDSCYIDYSYAFVCPSCKSQGLPDVLCQLEPSFFFWLHVSQDEPPVSGAGARCLHIMATGIHAESFMGTKADMVCRSQEIWKRAERRSRQLMQVAAQRPLTFGLRRSLNQPDEIYLENTWVVYGSKHLPRID